MTVLTTVAETLAWLLSSASLCFVFLKMSVFLMFLSGKRLRSVESFRCHLKSRGSYAVIHESSLEEEYEFVILFVCLFVCLFCIDTGRASPDHKPGNRADWLEKRRHQVQKK